MIANFKFNLSGQLRNNGHAIQKKNFKKKILLREFRASNKKFSGLNFKNIEIQI